MIKHQWITDAGVVYDLWRSSGSGVWLTGDGIEGMDEPEFDDFTDEADGLDGQEYDGWRAKPRAAHFVVAIESTETAGWYQTQSAFWRSLNPGRYGTWRVTAPDGSYRDLRCRRRSSASQPYATDPSVQEFSVRGVALVADDPWWRGPLIEKPFPPAEEYDFFPTSGDAVVQISAASSLDRAWVSNPGDQEAWPVWTVNGPASSFTVGVGNQLISADLTVPAGRFIRIDTDPTVQVIAWDDGTLVPFEQLLAVQFAPIPPGERVRLSAIVDGGGGAIDVAVSPRYMRAV